MPMQAPVEILRLTPADVPVLEELNALFGRAFAEPATYGAKPPSRAYLEALLGKEHIIALVARLRGEVVGGLVAYELDKFEQSWREIYIYDLAVAEDHRRRGIATALIGRLQRIAEKRQAWTIFVQADYGDDPAIRLYQALGSREDVIHFDIPVGKAEADGA
jgi:aminoglycoside 3-N-acetyltransferase I